MEDGWLLGWWLRPDVRNVYLATHEVFDKIVDGM